MANEKDIVLWIENKPERELHKIFEEQLNAKSIELCHVMTVDRLAIELEKIQANRIRGVIVDMMLDGPSNLSSFGLDVAWDHDEDDAGKILLNYILKDGQSRMLETPTMILTVRSNLDEDYIKQYKNTQLIIKRDMVNSNWLKNLEEWIKNL